MIIPVFPSLIHLFGVDDYSSVKDDLIKFVYKEKRKDSKGISISNIGGWQSNKDDYSSYENPLSSVIGNSISKYFAENKIFNSNVNLLIDSMWININSRISDYNLKHSHGGCDLAGCFYIKTPKDCGEIEFISPNEYTQRKELKFCNNDFKDSLKFHTAWKIPPQEGTLLIFPSSLYHHVVENRNNGDRISASFNMQISVGL